MRIGATFAMFLILGGSVAAQPSDDGLWGAGQFAFAETPGPFRIRAVSGSGTASDPAIIVQEFYSASAVQMRVHRRALPSATLPRDDALFLEIEILNASNLPWIEFSFELQEKSGTPSDYGDGLSFDQRGFQRHKPGSDSFSSYDSRFEPYDRLIYQEGAVDAGRTVRFRFVITDMTPQPVFYLVQDPRIPSS